MRGHSAPFAPKFSQRSPKGDSSPIAPGNVSRCPAAAILDGGLEARIAPHVRGLYLVRKERESAAGPAHDTWLRCIAINIVRAVVLRHSKERKAAPLTGVLHGCGCGPPERRLIRNHRAAESTNSVENPGHGSPSAPATGGLQRETELTRADSPQEIETPA